MNHVTIGVYTDNTYKVNVVRDKDLQNHIEYNKLMRFGRGLFVDGKCVNQGYLSNNQVQNWIEKIKKMDVDTSVHSSKYL